VKALGDFSVSFANPYIIIFSTAKQHLHQHQTSSCGCNVDRMLDRSMSKFIEWGLGPGFRPYLPTVLYTSDV